MTSSTRARYSHFFAVVARVFFALTIFFIPFRWRLVLLHRPHPPVYSDYTDFLIFASDLTLLYMLVFWAFSLLLSPRKLKAGPVLMWISLVGLTLAGWVSVPSSEDALLSRFHAVRFVVLLLFYLFIVNEIRSVGWVIWPVSAQIFFQWVIAILQVTSQASLGLQKYGELTLDPATLGTSIIFADGFRFLRGYGLSDHPNILGGCIAFGLVLLLAIILHRNLRARILASIVFLPCLLALVMTFSRSAWLSFFVAGSFMVGCEALARRWKPVKRAILLGVLSMLIVMPFITQNISLFQSRLNSGNAVENDPLRERGFLLDAGNTIFAEYIALGIGLGAAPLAMKNRFENFPLNYQPPHYAILVVAMETGVLGGVFYLLLLLVPALSFALRWKACIDKPRMMGAFALLLAMFVVGLFDYYTWLYAPGRLWQWMAWGLFSAAWKETI